METCQQHKLCCVHSCSVKRIGHKGYICIFLSALTESLLKLTSCSIQLHWVEAKLISSALQNCQFARIELHVTMN